MLLFILAPLVAGLSAQTSALAPAIDRPAIQVPAEPELTRQIVQADTDLFGLYFSGTCDVPRLREMLVEHAEFYHDRKGLVSTEGFVADYRKDCEGRADPKVPLVRRELVGGSVTVSPIARYGAFQTGEHVFYVRERGSTEKLASRRRFAVLWALGQDGRWRLSHVFDYRSPSTR